MFASITIQSPQEKQGSFLLSFLKENQIIIIINKNSYMCMSYEFVGTNQRDAIKISPVISK